MQKPREDRDDLVRRILGHLEMYRPDVAAEIREAYAEALADNDWSTADVAFAFGVSDTTVWRWIHVEGFPARKESYFWTIDPDDALAFRPPSERKSGLTARQRLEIARANEPYNALARRYDVQWRTVRDIKEKYGQYEQ